MKIADFRLAICYSSFAVHNLLLDPPFNDWMEQHVKQGLAWRPGSVSFSTLTEGPTLALEVYVGEHLLLRDDAVLAVQVPFVVPEGGKIGIDDFCTGQECAVPAGEYLLVHECGIQDPALWQDDPEYADAEQYGLRPMWSRLTFVPDKNAQPAVLRTGENLSPTYPLLMEAEPAG